MLMLGLVTSACVAPDEDDELTATEVADEGNLARCMEDAKEASIYREERDVARAHCFDQSPPTDAVSCLDYAEEFEWVSSMWMDRCSSCYESEPSECDWHLDGPSYGSACQTRFGQCFVAAQPKYSECSCPGIDDVGTIIH